MTSFLQTFVDRSQHKAPTHSFPNCHRWLSTWVAELNSSIISREMYLSIWGMALYRYSRRSVGGQKWATLKIIVLRFMFCKKIFKSGHGIFNILFYEEVMEWVDNPPYVERLPLPITIAVALRELGPCPMWHPSVWDLKVLKSHVSIIAPALIAWLQL